MQTIIISIAGIVLAIIPMLIIYNEYRKSKSFEDDDFTHNENL